MSLTETLYELHINGWTDGAIAQALGVDRTTVWGWRVGRHKPNIPTMRQLHSLRSLNQMAQRIDQMEESLDDSEGNSQGNSQGLGPENGSLDNSDGTSDAWIAEFFTIPVQ